MTYARIASNGQLFGQLRDVPTRRLNVAAHNPVKPMRMDNRTCPRCDALKRYDVGTSHDLVDALTATAKERFSSFSLTVDRRGIRAAFKQPGKKAEKVWTDTADATPGDILRTLCRRLAIYHRVDVPNPALDFLTRLTPDELAELKAITSAAKAFRDQMLVKWTVDEVANDIMTAEPTLASPRSSLNPNNFDGAEDDE